MSQCELSSRQKHVAGAKRGKNHVTMSWLVDAQTGNDADELQMSAKYHEKFNLNETLTNVCSRYCHLIPKG